jgi:hypothetical protein
VSDDPELAAPSDAFVRHRWIPARMVEWVQGANAIMLEHGAVHGGNVYDKHHEARWRARKLIRLMVELRLHERWELKEHVERRRDGFVWSVEYVGQHQRGKGAP